CQRLHKIVHVKRTGAVVIHNKYKFLVVRPDWQGRITHYMWRVREPLQDFSTIGAMLADSDSREPFFRFHWGRCIGNTKSVGIMNVSNWRYLRHEVGFEVMFPELPIEPGMTLEY